VSATRKAHTLFNKLLSYTEVCTAVTKDGDTTLMTLVHNPKVMASLQQASRCREDDTPPAPGFPSSLLALSDILEGRHSTSLQQYGTETRKKTGHTPNKVPGGLFTGSCGDETPSSSLATKPRPSPLLVSSTSHAIQKPVLKTSSTGTSEMGTRNSGPVAIQEFPKILGILKKEDKIIANFAAGKSQEPSTSNFDLLTSVFRGTEPVETENIKTTTTTTTTTRATN
ncbi:hypothetical protein GBAR_LOCUS5184, partial [Geodia barretti]